MKALFSDQGGKSWHMPLAACLIYVNEQVRFLPPVRELNIPSPETFGICCLHWLQRGAFRFWTAFWTHLGIFLHLSHLNDLSFLRMPLQT